MSIAKKLEGIKVVLVPVRHFKVVDIIPIDAQPTKETHRCLLPSQYPREYLGKFDLPEFQPETAAEKVAVLHIVASLSREVRETIRDLSMLLALTQKDAVFEKMFASEKLSKFLTKGNNVHCFTQGRKSIVQVRTQMTDYAEKRTSALMPHYGNEDICRGELLLIPSLCIPKIVLFLRRS